MTRPLVGLALATAALAACTKDVVEAPEPGPPASIDQVRGDLQRAEPGQTLSPLTVRVTDSADVPVPGVPVSWSFKQGAGKLFPPSGTTDGAGKVTTTVSLSTSVRDPQVWVLARVDTDSTLSADFLVLVGDEDFVPPTVHPDAEVSAGDNYFSPWSVTIPVGGTVVWTLVGKNPHNVDLYPGDGPRVWTLSGQPYYTGTGQWTATFDSVGDYHYICSIPPSSPGAHARHDGWVHVR